MNSPDLVLRIRTLLDEESASNWSDDEIYRALSDAQRQLASILNVNSETLRPLRKSASNTLSEALVALPADYFRVINLRYSHNSASESARKPCIIRDESKRYLYENNTYLKGNTTNYYAYLNATQVLFETPLGVDPGDTTGSYTLEYLSIPTEINAGVNPVISPLGHKALIYYAVYDLLQKDEKYDAAAKNYERFTMEAGGLK